MALGLKQKTTFQSIPSTSPNVQNHLELDPSQPQPQSFYIITPCVHVPSSKVSIFFPLQLHEMEVSSKPRSMSISLRIYVEILEFIDEAEVGKAQSRYMTIALCPRDSLNPGFL